MSDSSDEMAQLRAENAALRKINQALMQRVEQSLDLGEGPYALFERSVLLEEHVQARTQELEQAQEHLKELLEAQQQTQDALRYSEEMLRQITEHMGEVFWLRNADNSQIVYINPAYELIWGRSCRSLYERPESFLESIDPEDRPRIAQAYRSYLQGAEFSEEYRIIRPDGSQRWIQARSFPVRDSLGRVIRHTGIAVDISKRKRSEIAMEQQRANFQAFFQQSPISLIVHDPQSGAVLDANPAAIQSFGCGSLTELQEMPIFADPPLCPGRRACMDASYPA